MWENEHMFKSSQKLCQGDPAKHSPFIIVSMAMSHHLHHIEFESLSIIFIILFSSSFFKCLALWSSAPINKSAPIIQSITWRKAGYPYLADYFLYKWHQIYNFSCLPTYPLSKHEEKTHDHFPGRYSSQITIWVSHMYDNSRTHITAGTVSLTRPHLKVRCGRFGREIVCPNMRV